MKFLFIALFIIVLLFLFSKTLIESFVPRYDRRGRWWGRRPGPYWGWNRPRYYGSGTRFVYDVDYDYPRYYAWYNPIRWFRPPCKKGCVHEGNGIWGCPYAGNGLEDCVFASDCQGC